MSRHIHPECADGTNLPAFRILETGPYATEGECLVTGHCIQFKPGLPAMVVFPDGAGGSFGQSLDGLEPLNEAAHYIVQCALGWMR